jgi:hypothetical protein
MIILEHLLIFGGAIIVVGSLFIYFYPRLILSIYRRAILVRGFGDGPIPVNTLYTEPQKIFADPLSKSYSGSKLATTGVNRDTLYIMGWLDLSKTPQVLHVPNMNNRYYSVQFTNPSNNTNFAYIGKRTTGTKSGEYLITGPGWKGQVPNKIKQIYSPNNSVLVVGRVFVGNDKDLSTAHDLAKKIKLTPLE